jgi:hypothetical protein
VGNCEREFIGKSRQLNATTRTGQKLDKGCAATAMQAGRLADADKILQRARAYYREVLATSGDGLSQHNAKLAAQSAADTATALRLVPRTPQLARVLRLCYLNLRNA